MASLDFLTGKDDDGAAHAAAEGQAKLLIRPASFQLLKSGIESISISII
jgi:hypothetical protein